MCTRFCCALFCCGYVIVIIMNSHEVFIHIHQGCFAGTGAIVRLPQCQWSKPDGYGKISQCITTTNHSKAKTVCIFLVIYCSVSGNGPNNWANTPLGSLLHCLSSACELEDRLLYKMYVCVAIIYSRIPWCMGLCICVYRYNTQSGLVITRSTILNAAPQWEM